MGAWIEMSDATVAVAEMLTSHPTMGAWIEIHFHKHYHLMICSRTPRWVRGLKFYVMYFNITIVMSHPTMGAWIEMSIAYFWLYFSHVAPHDGCVD